MLSLGQSGPGMLRVMSACSKEIRRPVGVKTESGADQASWVQTVARRSVVQPEEFYGGTEGGEEGSI